MRPPPSPPPSLALSPLLSLGRTSASSARREAWACSPRPAPPPRTSHPSLHAQLRTHRQPGDAGVRGERAHDSVQLALEGGDPVVEAAEARLVRCRRAVRRRET